MTAQEISNYLFLEDKDQIGDIALVFGIRVWQDPLKKVIELYERKAVPKILFSGGVNRGSGEHEARNMYDEALRRGIPKDDLLLEDQATNTLENVLFSRSLLEEKTLLKDIHTICAVMAAGHARRALMTLKKNMPAGMTFKACPYFYTRYGFTKNDWMNSEFGNRIVKQEFEKIQTYLAKGDISEI